MADKDDIKELHQKIDNVRKELSASMAESSRTVTALAIQVGVLVESFKNIQKHDPPCVYFQKHTDEHKVISIILAAVSDHIDENKQMKKELRREGIGILGKAVVYIAAAALMLGVGAFTERHYIDQKNNVPMVQVK